MSRMILVICALFTCLDPSECFHATVPPRKTRESADSVAPIRRPVAIMSSPIDGPSEKEDEKDEMRIDPALDLASIREIRLNSDDDERDTDIVTMHSLADMAQQRPPPIDRLSRIHYTDAGTMEITIPSKGLDSRSIFSGAFAAAWFSAIVPATFATGGAPLLFLLPFWAAGGMVAKTAVIDPFVSGTLSVGEYYWKLENTFLGRTIQQKDGPTPQLRGAKAEIVAHVNDVPTAELKLYTESGTTSSFGLGLSVGELEYLAAFIDRHLEKLKKERKSHSSMKLHPRTS